MLVVALCAGLNAAENENPDGSWNGQKLSVLEWDANNPWEQLEGFRVLLSIGTNAVATNFVSTNRIELTNVLKELPNGIYRINVKAVDKIGQESALSTNLFLFWYGHPPARVVSKRVSFPPLAPPSPE